MYSIGRHNLATCVITKASDLIGETSSLVCGVPAGMNELNVAVPRRVVCHLLLK